jgi:hypothetical protein
MMSAAPKHDFRPLLFLIPTAAAAVAVIAVFFGIGLLLLRCPATLSVNSDASEQSLEAYELTPSQRDDTTPGSSVDTRADKPASPRPGATSNPDPGALGSTATETALIPSGEIRGVKSAGISRYRHRRSWKHWAAVWRGDSHPGPNPGGGFYGPPNLNVGHINPRNELDRQ